MSASGETAPAASMRERIERIQEQLLDAGLMGWLLYDFHGTNPIARSVLVMPEGPGSPKTTRRWFYLVPARGEPQKLVHRLEPRALDHLPGSSRVYLAWQELDRELASMIATLREGARGTASAPSPRLAMEYSPSARLPYVSRVDAGTLDLVRAAGAEVVSSADLAQRFGATLSREQRLDHRRTGRLLQNILGGAFARARDAVLRNERLTEVSLQRWIQERLASEGLTSSDLPTVAVNAHSGDPHFATGAAHDAPIGRGDFLLIDLWGKAPAPGSVYADYTQVAFLDRTVPDQHREIFAAVRDARDGAIAAVGAAVRAGRPIRGCDVDDEARAIIRSRGYGPHFVHRTGHSIGEEVHANGVCLDNLETRDERRLLDGTLVSVEPGIYRDAFGVRSEVNLLIDGEEVVVTTEPIQREIPALLA